MLRMTNRTTTLNRPPVAMTIAAIRFRHAERALVRLQVCLVGKV